MLGLWTGILAVLIVMGLLTTSECVLFENYAPFLACVADPSTCSNTA